MTAGNPRTGPGRWLLVVDDDEDICEAVQAVLERHGVRAETASDGRSALAVLRRSAPPAAVLVDLHMPFMSGADLVMAIREDAALAGVPIIGLSGAIDAPQVAARLSLDALLVKPVDVSQLLSAVERAFKLADEDRVGARQ